MRHGGVYARLCADSEVVDHAVLRGEPLGVYCRKELLDVHEALVDCNLAVAGVHIARTVGIAPEHGAEGGVGRLLYAGFGNANDAHGCVLLGILFWGVTFITLRGGKVKGCLCFPPA